MLYGLDICAGSGIGSAAFEALGFCQTVCYVERDAYCQRLIEQRMQDGWLAPAPIWDDLRTFDGRPWCGLVDFVFGGIPCQPHSLAGKRGGAADERDLWPDFWRVVREVGPSFVLVENVPGLLSSDGGTMFGRILGDLAEGGYDAEWDCIPAAAVGAPHRRDRVWVVAYARSAPDGKQRDHAQARDNTATEGAGVADTDGGRRACAGHNAGSDREGRQARADCPLGSESTLADASRGGQPTVWGPQGQAGQSDCSDETVADAQEQSIGAGLREGEQAGERRGRPSDGGSEGDLPHSDTLNGDGAGHRASTVPQQRQAGACDCGGNAGFAQSGLGRGPHGLACRMDVLAAAPAAWEDGTWEDGLPRVAEGVPERVNRLRVIGNGWVPQVAAVIAARIGGF